MIPQLDANGLLPYGRYATDLSEIEDVFVRQAPHSGVRSRIFTAFELYVSLVQDVLPSGAMWVDGGFCTYKSDPPKDIDVVIFADPTLLTPSAISHLATLVTLQGVMSQMPPLTEPRVQPMGGLVDSFLMVRGVVPQEQYWDAVWSTVKGADGKPVPGLKKGYLEVTW